MDERTNEIEGVLRDVIEAMGQWIFPMLDMLQDDLLRRVERNVAGQLPRSMSTSQVCVSITLWGVANGELTLEWSLERQQRRSDPEV
jgi:hypothetical protein